MPTGIMRRSLPKTIKDLINTNNAVDIYRPISGVGYTSLEGAKSNKDETTTLTQSRTSMSEMSE